MQNRIYSCIIINYCTMFYMNNCKPTFPHLIHLLTKKKLTHHFLCFSTDKNDIVPGWYRSMDWVPACKSKGLPVQFPVREHAWVAGQVSSRGSTRGNHTLMFFSIFFPPFPYLKINKWNIFKKWHCLIPSTKCIWVYSVFINSYQKFMQLLIIFNYYYNY